MAKKAPNFTFKDHESAIAEAVSILPPIIVIEGEEEYLRGRAIESIKSALTKTHPEISEITFHGPQSQGEGRFDFRDIIQELNSSSLFSSEKIVTFRRAERALFNPGASSDDGKKSTIPESFIDYLKNPAEGNFLLLEIKKINRQRIIGKALTKVFTIHCPLLSRQVDVANWLKTLAKKSGKELDRNAIDMLYTAHGGNLGALATEVEKLILFTGENPTITAEDAKEFMSGSVEFSIFELTGAIESRDMKKAIYYARLIIDQGSKSRTGEKIDAEGSVRMALSLIAGKLEDLLKASAARASRQSAAELAKTAGMSPWQAEKMMDAARNFTIRDLRIALDSIATEMHSANNTGSDSRLSLERAVIACTRRD